jgi:hypothetical protein
MRKGRSVTPAMGATNSRLGNSTGPRRKGAETSVADTGNSNADKAGRPGRPQGRGFGRDAEAAARRVDPVELAGCSKMRHEYSQPPSESAIPASMIGV